MENVRADGEKEINFKGKFSWKCLLIFELCNFMRLLTLGHLGKLGAKQQREQPKLNFIADPLRTIIASFLKQEISTAASEC